MKIPMHKTFFLFFFSFLVTAVCPIFAKADEKKAISCDQKTGPGEVFYNFHTLFIIYEKFPSLSNENSKSFPAALKFENFNKSLIDAMHKNFGSCLINSSGSEKNIIVFPNSEHIGDVKKEYELRKSRIHHSENLTLLISVDYHAGVEKTVDYALVSAFFYRPEQKYELSRLPTEPLFHTTVLFPTQTNFSFEKQLDNFFDGLVPSFTVQQPTIRKLDLAQWMKDENSALTGE